MPRTPPAVPTPTKTPVDTRRIMEQLAQQHPNADTELHFTNAYELLVATILSAQCTDERVNQVTPPLFTRYPDARALARATAPELEPQIQSTGFFRAKSRSLIGMATEVVERHGGNVPGTMEELVKLPGVGRKTANVVLGHALGVPGLPVDRHVLRVSNRIGIARSEDPEIVEQQLCAAMPPELWTSTSDTLILHGRRICKPRPLCDRCVVRSDCDYYQRVIKPSGIAVAGAVKVAAKIVATRRTAAGRVGPQASIRSESGKLPKPPRAEEPRVTGGAVRPHGNNRSESGKAPKRPRAAQPRATGDGVGPHANNRPESGKAPKLPQAAQPRGQRMGMGPHPNNRPESGKAPKLPQAAQPRGQRMGMGPHANNRSESGKSPKRSRAAQPRATGDGVGPHGNNRPESGKAQKVPRAAELRATGRGGGAPRQTKR